MNVVAARPAAVASRTVVGFGEASIDRLCLLPQLPGRHTSKLRIHSSLTTCGGQVATTMAACAALGLDADYLGPVGDDEAARRVLEELDARGVGTGRTVRRRAPTRSAVILVEEPTGERVVLWERDPALDVPPADLPGALIGGARVLHVDAVDESAAIHLAGIARNAGAIVTCDIDRVTPRTSELLSLVTHPVLAAHVPSQLTACADVEQALRALRASHSGLLCVTLGERGSAALAGDAFIAAPAAPVTPVDTTSAAPRRSTAMPS